MLNNHDHITYEELLVINLNGDLFHIRKSLSKDDRHLLRKNIKNFYFKIKHDVIQYKEKINLI